MKSRVFWSGRRRATADGLLAAEPVKNYGVVLAGSPPSENIRLFDIKNMGRYLKIQIIPEFCGEDDLLAINKELVSRWGCLSFSDEIEVLFMTRECLAYDLEYMNNDAEGLSQLPHIERPLSLDTLARCGDHFKIGLITIKMSGGMNALEARNCLGLSRWAIENADKICRRQSDNYDWETVRQYCSVYEDDLRREYGLKIEDFERLPHLPRFETLFDELTENYRIFAVRSLAADTDLNVEGRGFYKVSGGLRHSYSWYPKADKKTLIADCRNGFVFTARPYQLGQACDGTIGCCVTALFLDFCRKFGYSAEKLHSAAYLEQGFDYVPMKPEYQAEVQKVADWEEVAYPSVWDRTALSGLVSSLGAVNMHSLSNIITELPEFAKFDYMTGSFQQ